jgi:hypothetical protein
MCVRWVLTLVSFLLGPVGEAEHGSAVVGLGVDVSAHLDEILDHGEEALLDSKVEWGRPPRVVLLMTAPLPFSTIALMAWSLLASNSRPRSPPYGATVVSMQEMAVIPIHGSCIVTSAPRSTSRITASGCKRHAATMRGVPRAFQPMKAPSSWLMSAPLLSASSMALVSFAPAARWRAGAQQIPIPPSSRAGQECGSAATG